MTDILTKLEETIKLQQEITLQSAQVLERQLRVITLFEEIARRCNRCGGCRNFEPTDIKVETETLIPAGK